MTGAEWLVGAIKAVFAVTAVLAVAAFVLWPLWRKLREQPELPDFSAQFGDVTDLESELEIPTDEESAGKPERQELVELARSDPRRTAMLVSRWLKEKR